MAETMVVGVDGTADSLVALAAAADLAAAAKVSLVVVHVRHEPAMAAESVGWAAEGAMIQTLDEVQNMSRERAEDVLSGRSIRWRFEVATGDPATELIAAARRHEAETIVVGGRVHGLIRGVDAGSVAHA